MALVEHDAPVHVASPPPPMLANVQSGKISDAITAAAGQAAAGALQTLGAPQNPPWNLVRVNQRAPPLTGAFSAAPGAGAGVTVFVVDTGIRGSHQEFAARGGGPTRVAFGADFVEDATTATCPPGAACDCDGHGSHVSGIVGGLSAGIAPGVHLRSVRVLDCGGNGNISDVLAGLNYVAAVAQPPAIAVLSLGVPRGEWSVSLAQAVSSLVNTHGVLVVVAAGNSAGDSCSLVPSSVPEAISVGATSMLRYFVNGALPPASPAAGGADSLYTWTDTGPCVSIFAPGVNVLSACGGTNRCSSPGDASYAVATGTSMAAPHVAGAAAVLLSAQPGLTPAAARAALMASATRNALPNASMLPATPNAFLFVAPAVVQTAAGVGGAAWQTVAQAMAG